MQRDESEQPEGLNSAAIVAMRQAMVEDYLERPAKRVELRPKQHGSRAGWESGEHDAGWETGERDGHAAQLRSRVERTNLRPRGEVVCLRAREAEQEFGETRSRRAGESDAKDVQLLMRYEEWRHTRGRRYAYDTSQDMINRFYADCEGRQDGARQRSRSRGR